MIDQTNEKRYFSTDVHGADTTQSRVGARSNPYLINQTMTTKVCGSNQAAKDLIRGNFPKIATSEKNIYEGIQRIN